MFAWDSFSLKIWILFIAISVSVLSKTLDTVDTADIPKPERVAIQLNTYVESSEVPLNRKVKYNVELSWVGDLSRFRIEPMEQPILTNLLLEGSGSSNRVEPLDDGRMGAVKTITYQFKPVEMGMAYIDGLVVKYEDTETGEKDELQAQRVMVEIIEPIAEGDGGGLKAIIYIVLLFMFFGTLAYFIARYINRRKISAEGLPQNICLPQEYLTRISQDIDPKGANLSEMTSRLSNIFREYLSKDFHIAAKEASSQEIIEQLRIKQLDETDLIKMKDLFERFDLIKFAGEQVDPAEFSNIYGTIETFLLKQIKSWEVEQQNNTEE